MPFVYDPPCAVRSNLKDCSVLMYMSILYTFIKSVVNNADAKAVCTIFRHLRVTFECESMTNSHVRLCSTINIDGLHKNDVPYAVRIFLMILLDFCFCFFLGSFKEGTRIVFIGA